MTTVHIEDSTPEGRFLLDLIRNHKSVTIEPKSRRHGRKPLLPELCRWMISTQDSSMKFGKPTNSNARDHRLCHGIG